MLKSPEILLLTGFAGLNFGITPDLAEQVFGEPDEVQDLTDEILNNNSLVYHYWEVGCSLFFDQNKNNQLCSVETDNKEALLFRVPLFSLKEKELIQLMKENGYHLSDSEQHSWGEKRISFDAAGLDCYFQNNRLISVNFSQQENEFSFLPN